MQFPELYLCWQKLTCIRKQGTTIVVGLLLRKKKEFEAVWTLTEMLSEEFQERGDVAMVSI